MNLLEAGKRIALNNILFATDFSSHSDQALPYARAIARLYGAKLFGAHVVSSEDFLFVAPDLWPARIEQEGRLQQEVTDHLEEQLHGLPHQALFGVGEASTVLSRMISEHEIDLLVVGTHGRTGARKLLMGSVAEKIFRQASCPVLTVGPNVPPAIDNRVRLQRILFATDFGPESLAALRYALSLAEEHQAQLTLLHVVEYPGSIVDVEAIRATKMSRLRELVPPEAESWCRVEYLVEFSAAISLAPEKIMEIARLRGEDLIILGVRPVHGAIGAVTHFAHTTAQHIAAHAACPVLTVRE